MNSCPFRVINEWYKTLVDQINGSSLAKVAFCRDQVLYKLKFPPAKISAKPEDLVALGRHFGGFSGTRNEDAYADMIDAKKSEGVDGATYTRLLELKPVVKVANIDPKDPIASISTAYPPGRIQAFIDAGAYLCGTKNTQFIDAMLSGSGTSGGVYFDEAGTIVHKARQDGQSKPHTTVSESQLEKQITLYDQAHNDVQPSTREEPHTALGVLKDRSVQKMKDAERALRKVPSLKNYADKMERESQILRCRKDKAADLMPSLIESLGATAGQEVEVAAQIQVETLSETEITADTSAPVARDGSLEFRFNARMTDSAIRSLSQASQVHGGIFETKEGTKSKFFSIKSAFDIFDPAIFTTERYEPELDPDVKGDRMAIFHTARLPINDALFIKTKQGWKVIIGDPHENRRAVRDYMEAKEEKTSDTRAALVRVSTGSNPMPLYKKGDDQSCDLPFEGTDLDEFYHLYVQVKFFRGDILYTKREREALKKWLDKVGVDKAQSLFENSILRSRSEKVRANYLNSSLYRIFKEARRKASSTRVKTLLTPQDEKSKKNKRWWPL